MNHIHTNTGTQITARSCAEIPADNDALIAAITTLAGHINAAQHRFLKLLAALVEREAWGDGGGIKSPAHWLNYYCGIDLGAAREKVRVANVWRNCHKLMRHSQAVRSAIPKYVP